MPERDDGAKTIDLILPTLGVAPNVIRYAVQDLSLPLIRFAGDPHRYFRPQDVEALRRWLAAHPEAGQRRKAAKGGAPRARRTTSPADALSAFLQAAFNGEPHTSTRSAKTGIE